MPNVQPSLVSDKLEYEVSVGTVRVIPISGVTRDVKHDGTVETITVKLLTVNSDEMTIFSSENLFESAFTLRVEM